MGGLFDLSGRRAVITGSSRGIGKAIAERMAEHGARVVISSRKAEPCQEVAQAIKARFGADRALAIPANISDKAALEALVAQTREAWGGIDILVCNAASNPYFGPGDGIADEQYQKIFQNNILSNHWLSTLVASEMADRGEGVILLISSIAGLRGSHFLGAYAVSKAADMQHARNLAVELGPKGVRVNTIAPGLVKTDFARALWENPDVAKALEAKAPLRRLGEPDDIAGVAVFLASPAGAFVTGQTIVADGGVTIEESGI
ncbi:MAG: SDR family NAD(P)-dependent oxidoreductase [Maricaulaceae bacterium]